MKRIAALLLSLLMCFSLLAGCTTEEPPDTPVDPDPGKEPVVTPDPGKDPGKDPAVTPDPGKEPAVTPEPMKEYVYHNLRSGEESTVNPHNSNASANYTITDKISAVLYRFYPSEDGMASVLGGDLATEMPIDKNGDGKTWIIKLDPNAKWENGEKIDAYTMEYSWKMLLDPNLYWSVGTTFAKVIEGATAYQNQVNDKVTLGWDTVGIKVVDEHTLELTASRAYLPAEFAREFRLRTISPVYEPIYSKCISADGKNCDYGTSMDKNMCSGPFKLESWEKASQIVMLRNENWNHADKIHITKMISRVVGDESTRLELFEKGEADYIGLGTNGMAKYGEDPRVKEETSRVIHTMEVNQNHSDPIKQKLFNDPDFRKALFLAVDRNAIAKLTNNIAAPYYISTIGVVYEDGTTYRSLPEAKALIPENGGYDPEQAKVLMDKALKAAGTDRITIDIKYSEGSDGRRLASEYIQSTMHELFGKDKVEITLSSMTGTLLLTTIRSSRKEANDSWDLGWTGWNLATEPFAPWTKARAHASFYSNKYTNYKCDKLDELSRLAETPEYMYDEKKLAMLTVEMEKAMYENTPCIPVYQALSYGMYQERVDLPMKEYRVIIDWGMIYSKLKDGFQ